VAAWLRVWWVFIELMDPGQGGAPRRYTTVSETLA